MKPLIVANWKMNPVSLAEAKLIFDAVSEGIKNIENVEVVICPPSPYLSFIKSGAQDVFYEEKGAYTGEVSPLMLKDMGVKYVILGHSERRKYSKETDGMVLRKLEAAMGAGLKPILCIDKVSQIPKSIKEDSIVAYEPLFAIGTGKACSVERAKKMKLAIQKKAKVKVRVLYGGSVNSQNAQGYIKEAGFQGLLVGGASLKPEEFIEIIRAVG